MTKDELKQGLKEVLALNNKTKFLEHDDTEFITVIHLALDVIGVKVSAEKMAELIEYYRPEKEWFGHMLGEGFYPSLSYLVGDAHLNDMDARVDRPVAEMLEIMTYHVTYACAEFRMEYGAEAFYNLGDDHFLKEFDKEVYWPLFLDRLLMGWPSTIAIC